MDTLNHFAVRSGIGFFWSFWFLWLNEQESQDRPAHQINQLKQACIF